MKIFRLIYLSIDGIKDSNTVKFILKTIKFIKIDGSLIKNIIKNKKHQIIVETIVSFATRIGIQTVAEFICDSKILEAIKNLGITRAQSFHIGKPKPF